ncbi:hypothetical protein FKW77_005018 [Venturia effusa]|uniref:Heterokaryon incompatibility domain-containing protein n=1 Tax=Venturia effusa TaxID=50376 RepID=A0A517L978_9PEZI|nr:hypothetical protein FKW77_005018 [Venturia effusa]
MAGVYRTAVLTIAVGHGNDTTAGCFPNRQHLARWSGRQKGQDRVYVRFRTARGGKQKVFISETIDHDSMKGKNSPLFGRGWAFQERLLSTRILHFMDKEVFWDCRTLSDCECGQYPFLYAYDKQREQSRKFHAQISRKLDGSAEEIANARSAWYKMVRGYSKRSLSFSEDKLPAFSGLASVFRQPELGRYLAGIWESHLPGALPWTSAHQLTTDVLSDRAYRAPSWSWASSEGKLQPSMHDFASNRFKHFLPRIAIDEVPVEFGYIA